MKCKNGGDDDRGSETENDVISEAFIQHTSIENLCQALDGRNTVARRKFV